MLSDVIGVTHPTTTALTPRIDGAMIITQIIESIVGTEKKTGVTTEIASTEVTLTIPAIANTEITEPTGIPAHTEITKIMVGTESMVGTKSMMGTKSMVGTERMVGTESMGTTNSKGGRRYTLQAECPLELRIGPTLVKCLWRDRLSSTPSKLDGLLLCVV